MTGGEISKKREAELQKSANYGRGLQLVKDLRSGGSRVVASAPTLGELGGDIVRGLVGGQAKEPSYLKTSTTDPGTKTVDYKQYTPKPEKVKGLIPAIGEKVMDVAGQGGLVGMAYNAIMGKENLPKQKTIKQKYDEGVSAYSTLLGGQRNKKGGLIK